MIRCGPPATYGTVDKHPYKGRHAPGHSILPNLLMYQVAQREGRGDATNYLNAARTQAQWIIDNLDWADPRTTKGHRMSEHKMMPGLVYFADAVSRRRAARTRRQDPVVGRHDDGAVGQSLGLPHV